MIILADFIAMFGQVEADKIIQRAGVHQSLGQPAPDSEEDRLLYGLMEILDFECLKYGDYDGLTQDQIKDFLVQHKDSLTNIHIPSFIGLMAGAFGFLEQPNRMQEDTP